MKHTSLAQLMEEFDVFLLDQFGVLLDGQRCYPGAPKALAELSNRGKKVGILTNSGKRAAPNSERLDRMGLSKNHIDAVVSSGEAARAILRSMIGNTLNEGAAVLILARDNDQSGIEGLALRSTDDPSAADLVLIAGSRGEELPLEAYKELLEDPVARGIPALCTNPDMKMLTEHGSFFGAGRIAQLFREMGGQVDEIGKPHKLIYQVALEQLGGVDPSSGVCIGDSPAHDIRGAHAAGCKGALVRTGIHAKEPLDQLLTKLPQSDVPDFVIPDFGI